MLVTPIKTPIFKENQNLEGFVVDNVKEIKEGDIIAITSKIVALSEGRTAPIEEKHEWIEKESEKVIESRWCKLTLKDNQWCANAGIDESNGDGKIILWPKDSYASAQQLRNVLKNHYGLEQLGVIITDSRTTPLRCGVVGVSLGHAGFKGLRDYRGSEDIFGRKIKLARTDVADSIASTAVLIMGEGSETIPLAVISNAPVEYCETVERDELVMDPEDDLYRPLFNSLN